jgi:hypothetical protein
MVVVAVVLVLLVAAATAGMMLRRRPELLAVTDDEPADLDRWPITAGDDSAAPYTRGMTSAARLAGRR